MGAGKFKSLDYLLSEASGSSHTRETSRHAEKIDHLWSEAHSGGCSEVLCTKGAGQKTLQNLSMKKKLCSSGYTTASSDSTDTFRSAAQLPASPSCLIFGERASTLKPPRVRAHHPGKQWLCSMQQDGWISRENVLTDTGYLFSALPSALVV